jgi:hypothetical protein
MNFAAYWTGDELSDTITQQNMKRFILKLAAILLSSTFNFRRRRLFHPSNGDEPGSPNDVVEIENPK